LNLPCFSLENPADTLLDNHNKILREDLSYLPLHASTGHENGGFAIYETRTTVVISGCNNLRWFGYALGNIGPVDPSPDDDDITCTFGEGDADPEPEEDFFATGGCEPVINPRNVTWDPRVYFLRATQFRMEVATRAAVYLVQKLDAACRDWVSCHRDRRCNTTDLLA
jgi:hypothetical protein